MPDPDQYYKYDYDNALFYPVPPPKRRPRAKPPPKRRGWPEFSQWMVIVSWAYVFLVLAGTFLLSWHERQEMPGLDTISITTFGGFVTSGYYTLCGWRSWSENKYGRQGKKDAPDSSGANTEEECTV